MTLSRGLRLGLAGALAASAWVALQPDDEPVARSRPVPRTAPAAPVAWPASALRPAAAAWGPPGARALAAWGPPPPAPPPPASVALAAPPPPPQAPPFPYTLLGRVLTGDEVRAVLSSPTRTLGVQQADVIDGQWRVDDIRADGLSLTWLPGGLPQTLRYRPS